MYKNTGVIVESSKALDSSVFLPVQEKKDVEAVPEEKTVKKQPVKKTTAKRPAAKAANKKG